MPIDIPGGVEVKIDGQAVTVKGPKGELALTVASPIEVAIEENQVVVTADDMMPVVPYVRPGSAKASRVIAKLNPPQRFPSIDMNTRAFPGPAHPADVAPNMALTADEYYLLILNIDMGAQFYFRENKPGKAP